jgi:uracil-DNA glycosylase family 4
MPNIYVPGVGNPCAKLAIVGEAPGAREEELRIPFVGLSGDLLNECLEYAGIGRGDVYITNVCKVRPPYNKIKDLHLIGRSIEEFIPQLVDELNNLDELNCILAVGSTALEYLTGNKGIKNFRGSILPCRLTKHKVVATLHPAMLLHDSGESMLSWKEIALIKHDIKRAAEQSLFPEIRSPSRTLEIARNSLDVYRFLNTYNGHRYAASDVETSKTIPICTSIAFNKWHAISIPTLDKSIPDHDLGYIWRLLAEFYGDCKIKLIAQNGKFDEKRCRQLGLKWHDLYFDTMLAWHTLYAEMPKRLAVISSLLTEEPYYKDEGSEYNPKKHNFDRLLLYNAKDSAIEFECYEEEMKQFDEEPELADFFFKRVMPLHRLYSNMEDVGLLVDLEIRKNLHKKYTDLRKEKYEQLIERIVDGDETLRDTFGKFNPNSPKQVANLIFGFLGCPVRKDTGEDTLKALVNNSIKDERRKFILTGILEQRKIRKTIGTYIEASTSGDNRIRTEMMIVGTESGRTSTQVRKPPTVIIKEGLAFQTMTKHEDPDLEAGGADLRSMFIADEGYSFIEPDLSQAEDRVVCVLSKDWEALKNYDKAEYKRNKHGLKDDRHTLTAMQVCELRFEDVTDYDRQIGKKTRHAANYAMGKHQFMLNNARYGVFISEWKCGKLLEAFHAANPNIKGVYHEEIQSTLANNNCTLYSPHGRKRQFFNKWGDELFKEAYSYIPQATVSDQTKFALLEIVKQIEIYPVLESHDSFLALIRDDLIEEAAKIIKRELERPINFSKCTLSRNYDLVIPCEIKVGKRWIEQSKEFSDGMRKYKL